MCIRLDDLYGSKGQPAMGGIYKSHSQTSIPRFSKLDAEKLELGPVDEAKTPFIVTETVTG